VCEEKSVHCLVLTSHSRYSRVRRTQVSHSFRRSLEIAGARRNSFPREQGRRRCESLVQSRPCGGEAESALWTSKLTHKMKKQPCCPRFFCKAMCLSANHELSGKDSE
jgi:hypothetical protein